jgi:hypothetical protein
VLWKKVAQEFALRLQFSINWPKKTIAQWRQFAHSGHPVPVKRGRHNSKADACLTTE